MSNKWSRKPGTVCIYCEKPAHRLDPITRDHVIPKYYGGTGHPANMVPAHDSCNCAKGKLTIAEYSERVGIDLKKLRRRIRQFTGYGSVGHCR